MATQLGREFIRELLTGYDLHRGPGPAIEALNHTYYGHLRRALQTCIKGICTQFERSPGSEAAAPPQSPPIHDVRREPPSSLSGEEIKKNLGTNIIIEPYSPFPAQPQQLQPAPVQ